MINCSKEMTKESHHMESSHCRVEVTLVSVVREVNLTIKKYSVTRFDGAAVKTHPVN